MRRAHQRAPPPPPLPLQHPLLHEQSKSLLHTHRTQVCVIESTSFTDLQWRPADGDRQQAAAGGGGGGGDVFALACTDGARAARAESNGGRGFE